MYTHFYVYMTLFYHFSVVPEPPGFDEHRLECYSPSSSLEPTSINDRNFSHQRNGINLHQGPRIILGLFVYIW